MKNYRKKLTGTQSLLVFLITIFIYIPLDWFTFTYLWNNLIVAFFGLPVITSLLQSAGLILFKNYLFSGKKNNEESEDGAFYSLFLGIIKVLITLTFGWIIIKFI